jgi:hypothetical protein
MYPQESKIKSLPYMTPEIPQPQTIEKKVVTQQPATFSHNNTTPDNPALDLLQQAVMFDTLFL